MAPVRDETGRILIAGDGIFGRRIYLTPTGTAVCPERLYDESKGRFLIQILMVRPDGSVVETDPSTLDFDFSSYKQAYHEDMPVPQKETLVRMINDLYFQSLTRAQQQRESETPVNPRDRVSDGTTGYYAEAFTGIHHPDGH